MTGNIRRLWQNLYDPACQNNETMIKSNAATAQLITCLGELLHKRSPLRPTLKHNLKPEKHNRKILLRWAQNIAFYPHFKDICAANLILPTLQSAAYLCCCEAAFVSAEVEHLVQMKEDRMLQILGAEFMNPNTNRWMSYSCLVKLCCANIMWLT